MLNVLAHISISIEIKIYLHQTAVNRQLKYKKKNYVIQTANNKIKQQPVLINGTQVPYANTAKYLGMTLGVKLRWKERIKKKT
jgi:hypothetical protein